MACGRQHYKACGRRHKGQAILPRGLNSLPTRQIDDDTLLEREPLGLVHGHRLVLSRPATDGCDHAWLRQRMAATSTFSSGCSNA